MIIGIRGYIGHGKDTLANMLKYHIELQYIGRDPISSSTLLTDFQRYTSLQKLQEGSNFEKRNQLIKIVSFADTLKGMVYMATGCSRENLNDQEFKKSFMPSEWDYTINDARQWLLNKSMLQEIEESIDTITEMDRTEICHLAVLRDFEWKRTYRQFMIELGDKIRSLHPDYFVLAMMKDYGPHNGFLSKDNWLNWIVPDVRRFNEAEAVRKAGGFIIMIDNGKPSTINHPTEPELDGYKFDVYVKNTGTLEDLFYIAGDIVSKLKLSEYANTNSCPFYGKHRNRYKGFSNVSDNEDLPGWYY